MIFCREAGTLNSSGLWLTVIRHSLVGLSSLRGYNFIPGNPSPSGFVNIIASVVAGLIVIWIFFLVATIFLKRSYDSVSKRLNVGMFHTTGLLYVIGAATIIIRVGVIIVLIAEILQIVAFFSIPEQLPVGPQPMPGQMQPPPGTMLAGPRK
jgi:uncharacterized membrane protein